MAKSLAAMHPIIPVAGAGLATAVLAPKVAKGISNLYSRLGRGRRLKLLRQGIAPKAYQNIAKQHGFR